MDQQFVTYTVRDRVAEIVRALKGVAYPNTDKVATADINDLLHSTVIVTRTKSRRWIGMRPSSRCNDHARRPSVISSTRWCPTSLTAPP